MTLILKRSRHEWANLFIPKKNTHLIKLLYFWKWLGIKVINSWYFGSDHHSTLKFTPKFPFLRKYVFLIVSLWIDSNCLFFSCILYSMRSAAQIIWSQGVDDVFFPVQSLSGDVWVYFVMFMVYFRRCVSCVICWKTKSTLLTRWRKNWERRIASMPISRQPPSSSSNNSMATRTKSKGKKSTIFWTSS